MAFRTDRNNNPIAFTTDIAKQAGLMPGRDFVAGESFNASATQVLWTAKLLRDPIETCIQVIDRIGFYTQKGLIRWVYIGIPSFVWQKLGHDDKKKVIQFMYRNEGGTELEHLFQ